MAATAEIVDAAERDLEAFNRIYNEEVLHTTATWDIKPWSLEETRAWMLAHGDAAHPLLALRLDGKTRGYASLSPYRHKDAYQTTAELSIYIDRSCRRRGYATAMLEELLARARRTGIIHNIVAVITAGNEASIALHRHFGFSFCGRIPECGVKFGRFLSIDNYSLLLAPPHSGAAGPGGTAAVKNDADASQEPEAAARSSAGITVRSTATVTVQSSATTTVESRTATTAGSSAGATAGAAATAPDSAAAAAESFTSSRTPDRN